jgi:S1-C subfamily serine protease
VTEQAGADRRLFRVVVASLTTDVTAEIGAPGGKLAALIRTGIEVATAQPDEPDVAADGGTTPDAEDGEAVDGPSAGTAFFVNNTDLVTARHVVDGCASLEFVDGTELKVLARHQTLDLALLVSPRRSRDWIPVHLTGEARLGQPVVALGYPYFGTYSKSLNSTGGNVSALTGIGDDPHAITIIAPVQPGNSGGPLLARDGTVIGVVIARLDRMLVAEATGSLPENINYAVPGQDLLDFLDSEGVSLPRIGSEPVDFDEGIPDGMQRAVVPVICRK